MKLLKQMYWIHSLSFKEQQLSEFVENQLVKIGVKDYTVDKDHQIYRLIPDTPLINAHMDQVNHPKLTKLEISNEIIKGDSNLGADDKNGVWILLNILNLKEFKNKISFIFSTGEENGGNIHQLLTDEKDKINKLKYGLVFDRRGKSDIIGTRNYYCVKELEEDIKKIGKEFGYTTASGVLSDADSISSNISCVNLSCGYYDHHTKKEYTIIKDLKRSLSFGIKILNTIDKTYEKPEKPAWKYYGNYYDNWKDDYDYNSFNTGNYTTVQSQQRSIENIRDVIDNIDSGEFYYYCHTCYHYLPIKLAFIEKDKLKICPFCGDKFRTVSNRKEIEKYKEKKDEVFNIIIASIEDNEDEDYRGYHYCPDCDIIFDAYVAVTEHNKICSKCHGNLIHMS